MLFIRKFFGKMRLPTLEFIYKASTCDIKTALLTFACGLGKVDISADIFLRLDLLNLNITSGAHFGLV